MRSSPGLMASALVGGLVLLCVPSASAQGGPKLVRVASLMSGSIAGAVQDELGAPVSGAMVSAVGATTAVAYTDRRGRFELLTLSPGPYLLRAQLAGFVTPRGAVVEVRASSRSASSIELRRLTTVPPVPPVASVTNPKGELKPPPLPVVTASLGAIPETQTTPDTASVTTTSEESPTSSTTRDSGLTNDDHSEVAWRLRYARRGVLKDATLPADLAAAAPPRDASSIFGSERSDNRLATSLVANMPLSGQFNLLTASSFDSPEQLFSTNSFARSIAYMSVVAPAGDRADWSMRGALTQGDISSWFVAADYATRGQARHQYDLGISYSTQRYDGGNPSALREMGDGNRSVGVVAASDTLALTPDFSVTYGARYASYGYLSGHGLLSPSLAVTLVPADGLRVNARMATSELAPGAEEFLPPGEGGIWLPPQRTFSTLAPGQPLKAERTTNFSVEAEHNLDAEGTSIVSVRVFHQNVSDQLVTMFGVETPDSTGTPLGHYFVGSSGHIAALGWAAGFHTTALSRVRGSIEYRMTQATWTQADDTRYLLLLAPLVVRPSADRVQDVSTSIETNVPETATRVLVVCRLSNLHAMGGVDRPMYDSRFDVQVRQSLPFMDFSNARWEMLLAVRNFFREATADSSVYDELLVVRPPKRIVGGLTLRF